jgi:hypothetical protein
MERGVVWVISAQPSAAAGGGGGRDLRAVWAGLQGPARHAPGPPGRSGPARAAASGRPGVPLPHGSGAGTGPPVPAWYPTGAPVPNTRTCLMPCGPLPPPSIGPQSWRPQTPRPVQRLFRFQLPFPLPVPNFRFPTSFLPGSRGVAAQAP